MIEKRGFGEKPLSRLQDTPPYWCAKYRTAQSLALSDLAPPPTMEALSLVNLTQVSLYDIGIAI